MLHLNHLNLPVSLSLFHFNNHLVNRLVSALYRHIFYIWPNKFPIIKPNCPETLFYSIINDFRSIFHSPMYSARSSKDVLITSNSNNNKLGTDNPRLTRRKGIVYTLPYPTLHYLRAACFQTHRINISRL